jgi:hypothetical protein
LSISTSDLRDQPPDPFIDFTTDTFALDEDWLLRGTSNVLHSHDFYKSVDNLAQFLLIDAYERVDRRDDRPWPSRWDLWTSRRCGLDGRGGSILFVSTEEPLYKDPEAPDSQHIPVGAVYQVPILEFNGRTVYRFCGLRALPWDYWRSRETLIAIMLVAEECGIDVVGRTLPSKEDVFDVCSGRRFPEELTSGGDVRSPLTGWRPQYPDRPFIAGPLNDECHREWSSCETRIKDADFYETIAKAKRQRQKRLWGEDPPRA